MALLHVCFGRYLQSQSVKRSYSRNVTDTAAPVEAAEAVPSAAAPCFLASQFRSLYDRLQSLSYMRYEGPRSALEFFSSFFWPGDRGTQIIFGFVRKPSPVYYAMILLPCTCAVDLW